LTRSRCPASRGHELLGLFEDVVGVDQDLADVGWK
jgi:hypothetical protein